VFGERRPFTPLPCGGRFFSRGQDGNRLRIGIIFNFRIRRDSGKILQSDKRERANDVKVLPDSSLLTSRANQRLMHFYFSYDLDEAHSIRTAQLGCMPGPMHRGLDNSVGSRYIGYRV
jgi:hypothetical protein